MRWGLKNIAADRAHDSVTGLLGLHLRRPRHRSPEPVGRKGVRSEGMNEMQLETLPERNP
jgi:hypothetical protein